MKKIVKPDFIGLGGQRCATSWIYSCLYDHPGICIPVKEIHFFSRERNWSKGYEWYESIFSSCRPEGKKGEFSTSYLYDEKTPSRIKRQYPDVKLIVSLRNPVDRAYSHYVNAMMAGEISNKISFNDALRKNKLFIDNGLYGKHLLNFLKVFPKKQIKIMIHDDSKKNPRKFMEEIYDFIGVDKNFRSSMLEKKVNIGRVPKSEFVGRVVRGASGFLRKIGFEPLLMWLRKKGFTDKVLEANKSEQGNLSAPMRRELWEFFEEDVKIVEGIIGRELPGWRPE